MNTDNTLKAIIDKYKLSDPIPGNIRAAMEKSRRENLAKILKKDAYSAVFITAVVSFFLWIKKFGVSISITKSAAAVSAALIICMGALTVAGVYTVKKFTDYLPEEKQKIENLHPGSADKTVIPSVPDIFSYNVAVSQVEMDDVSSELLESYRNKMTEELKKIRGTNAAINMEKLDAAHISGKILSITIIKLSGDRKDSDAESSYRISAKIINSSNSQVLMYSSVTADNENAIKDSLSLLAEKISGKL